MSFDIVYRAERGMTLATWGSVFVMVMRDDISVERMAIIRDHELAFLRKLGGKKLVTLSLLDVTDAHIVGSQPGGREAAAQLNRDMAPHLLGSAVLLDREGFVASLLRSMITTIHLVSGSPAPLRVFRDLPSAVGWLESCLAAEPDGGLDVAGLLGELPGLRAVVGP